MYQFSLTTLTEPITVKKMIIEMFFCKLYNLMSFNKIEYRIERTRNVLEKLFNK